MPSTINDGSRDRIEYPKLSQLWNKEAQRNQTSNTMNVDNSIMFEQLKLVDRTDSSLNAQDLPQTLDGCVGK